MARRTSTPKETPTTPPQAKEQTTLPDSALPDSAVPDQPVPKAAPPQSRQGLLLGAAIALAASILGYGAALKFPLPGFGENTAANPQLETQLADILAINTALAQRIDALEGAPVIDTAPLQNQITALEIALQAVAQPDPNLARELAEIRAKLAQSDPAPAIAAAIADEIAQVEDAASQMVAKVQEAAAQAVAMAAQSTLRSALDTGVPYVAAAGTLNLPPILADNAQTGIPSLLTLKDSFPAAARTALEAALRADMGQTWSQRVANFLRSQTGARALAPREGNDPDAILSRMEAALSRADLSGALTESAALPPAALDAMQPWLDAANLRALALAAFAALPDGGN